MTRTLLLILITCTAMLTARAEVALWPANTTLLASEPATVKVLSINNSLIDYNDQYAMFNNMASAMGKDAQWTKHTNLGKTLAYHFNEDPLVPNAQEVVASEVWTHIILQEQSSLPRNNFEQFRTNVQTWVDYIRTHCPNPQVVIILPINWPFNNDADYQAAAATFVANYRKVAQEFGLVLCPSGMAYANYQAANPSTFSADLYTDDRHPTWAATYLAACLEYAVIFNADPATITWKHGNLTEDKAAAMRSCAKATFDSFTQIVNQHAHSVHYEIHGIDANGLSTGMLKDAGTETFTASGNHTVKRTYESQELEATVRMAEAETVVPESELLPAISITGTDTYTQDFNSIGGEDVDPSTQEKTAYVRETTLPEGWRIDNNIVSLRTVRSFTAVTDKTMYIGGQSLASNAKNGTWNFGATGSTDRAVGGITSSVTNGARTVNLMAHLRNDAHTDYNTLTLSYDVEKYRNGANEAGFIVQLYTSTDGVNWASAGSDFCTTYAKDANTDGAAVVPIDTKHVSGVMECAFDADADLFLAWSISVASGEDCAKSMALAIDNVSIALSKVVQIPSYAIIVTDNSTLTENFDSMGGSDADPSTDTKTGVAIESTLPMGWKIERNLRGPRQLGAYSAASETTMYIGGQSLASNAYNGTWNFGATGSTDRALGGLTTGVDGGTRGLTIMVRLFNNSETDFEGLNLAYDIEKYRNGSNTAGFTVQLYTSKNGVNWTSAGADFCTSYAPDANTNGFASVPASTTQVSKTLAVDFPVEENFYLGWNISVTSGTSCNAAPGYAIDNVSITPLVSVPSGVENLTDAVSNWTKVLRDGQLLLQCGSHTYTMQGIRVK